MADAAQFGKIDFELTGGALCLDFANTSDDQKAPEKGGEKIHTYADLLAFSVQTGDLAAVDARKLLLAANHSGGKSDAALRKSRELRDAIYHVFSNAAAERKPPLPDIETLNRYRSESLRHSRIVAKNGGYQQSWDDGISLERPLWSIVASAIDLLTSGEFKMVRECGADKCSWLFLDRSRNRSRRWCDMKVCGNRAKARRHYERVKS